MDGLIFDKRDELGDQPGLHALVIGISSYPYLLGGDKQRSLTRELQDFNKQLPTPALDVNRLCQWLLDAADSFSSPLATIRLLVSPLERAEFPGAADARLATLLDAAREWRNDACRSAAGATLFYYTGWGFGASHDDVAMMLQDVGESPHQTFRNIVSFDSIYRGMRPASREESIARSQFYFVDTGRADVHLSRGEPSPVFDIPYGSRDDRVAPVYYASVPGQWALAWKDRGSVLMEGLLPAMQGEAASRTEEYRAGELVWEVTVNSLNHALERYFGEISEGVDQAYSLGGLVRDIRIRTLDGPPPNRALIVDNQIDGPAVHALIIGVSDYLHLPGGRAAEARLTLGMKQLTSTATSARAFSDWLRSADGTLPCPLGSVRLLLSPSAGELERWGMSESPGDRASLANFLATASAWRKDATADPDSMTIFFFAGHGAQRAQDDAVLMLEDFGDGRGGLLSNAIDLSKLWKGMAPFAEHLRIAREQWYIVDACRVVPEECERYAWMNTTPIFDEPKGPKDDRARPMLFASIPGTTAYGRPGGLTLFTEALLECLEAKGTDSLGSEPLQLTAMTLNRALQRRFESIAEQAYELGGQIGKDPVFRTLPAGYQPEPIGQTQRTE